MNDVRVTSVIAGYGESSSTAAEGSRTATLDGVAEPRPPQGVENAILAFRYRRKRARVWLRESIPKWNDHHQRRLKRLWTQVTPGGTMADTFFVAMEGGTDGQETLTQNSYLDTAAELSKIDQKAHHQTKQDGKPLVYDMLLTFSTSPSDAVSAPDKEALAEIEIKTVPENWTVRNACRQAHFLREEQREEAGVSKQSIGRYAKTMRFNMDEVMFGEAYSPGPPTTGTPTQRLYALDDVSLVRAFNGGTWDYTQLAQFTEDAVSGVTTGDPFYLNILSGHSAAAPGPYTYIGVLLAYHQRRQTVRDESTLTPGGDTQFVVNDSPFFRIPIQDVGEDSYVEITLDEQDEPPYERSIALATADRLVAQPQAYAQLTAQNTINSVRIQAPLGLVEFESALAYNNQVLRIKVEVLGTYEM
jgi:hypothetical protein